MLKDLQKFLKKYSIDSNESIISMVLGGVIVILLGFLAYNYFRFQNPAANTNVPAVPEITENGEITNPLSAVALPATHKVMAGETLWSIAEKYYASGYNYQDIAQANNISDATTLEVNQELTIPKVSVREPLTVTTSVAQTITASRIDGAKYTVVSGDDVWDIAVRAYGDGFRWVEIAKANNLVNPGLIHPGNVLVIPR